MSQLVFLVSVLLVTVSSGVAQKGEEMPSDSLIEALRQVFRIPDKAPSISEEAFGRPFRFMMKLYKKISSGESLFPQEANTIRSIMPHKASDAEASLVFNLTSAEEENIVAAYLLITGRRRRLNRPSRLVFYLGLKKDDEGGRTRGKKLEPVMVTFVDKLPLEVDLISIAKNASEWEPPLPIRVEEQQLRRGHWMTNSVTKLKKKMPILILVSTDPHVLNLEAFRFGAANLGRTGNNHHMRGDETEDFSILDSQQLEELEQRFKRSLTEVNSQEFYGSVFQPKVGIQGRYLEQTEIMPNGKSPKDKYRIQKEALRSTISSAGSRAKYTSKSASPLLTNLVEPYSEKKPKYDKSIDTVRVDNTHHFHVTPTSTSGNSSIISSAELYKKSDTASTKAKGNKPSDEDDDSENQLLLPLKEYRTLPKRRNKKKNKKQSDFISFPEYYTSSWENWEHERPTKWRKKPRRGEKKKKVFDRRINRKKAMGFPKILLQAGMTRLRNTGVVPPSDSDEKCYKRKYYVDFQQLGWAQKYIIAPEGFDTFFCSGQCPTPLSLTDAGTNHAIIQSLLRAANFSPGIPSPCCVPASLDSLTILLKEEDDLALRTLPAMIVKSCSCQ